jgi:uncharacterized protein
LSIIADTSFVLALYNDRDELHDEARHWVALADDEFVMTPLTVAEIDHLVARGGEQPRQTFWRDLGIGAWTVRWWADAMDETLRIVKRHPFLRLTDASLVALAQRLRTDRIATFDQHFRGVKLPRGKPFVMLPDDAIERT